MRVIPASLLLVIVGACTRTPAPAARQADSAPPAKAPGALAYLRGLVGRYPNDTRFWDSEPLRSRMTKLLGGDYQAFRDNIATSGPVAESGGLIYLIGNCASSAKAWGAAALVVDPAGDKLALKLFTDAGGLRTFGEGEIAALPPEVMTAIQGWKDRARPPKKPAPTKKPAETKG